MQARGLMAQCPSCVGGIAVNREAVEGRGPAGVQLVAVGKELKLRAQPAPCTRSGERAVGVQLLAWPGAKAKTEAAAELKLK
ncbi:hypothetical protein B0G69_4586 [Paraburkholderia sp. RAU2J]|nr:hypothetical protein B0G69_4586 [Paraburkholderia sp. RAU2J]